MSLNKPDLATTSTGSGMGNILSCFKATYVFSLFYLVSVQQLSLGIKSFQTSNETGKPRYFTYLVHYFFKGNSPCLTSVPFSREKSCFLKISGFVAFTKIFFFAVTSERCDKLKLPVAVHMRKCMLCRAMCQRKNV